MTCSSALDGGRSYHAWAKTEKHFCIYYIKFIDSSSVMVIIDFYG